MLSKHDELLLRDLRLQPLWLLWVYIAVGVVATVSGVIYSGASVGAVLCVGGGFLVALGAEKLVTRRIRLAAIYVVSDKTAPDSAPQPTGVRAAADDRSSARG